MKFFFFTKNPNLNNFFLRGGGGGVGEGCGCGWGWWGVDGWTVEQAQTNLPFNFFEVGGIATH